MGSVKKNIIYNISYQILILIVPFITSPYVSRVLGPEGLGTYSVTTAIVIHLLRRQNEVLRICCGICPVQIW